MPLVNSISKFSTVLKSLHWALFALVITQYSLITHREYFAATDVQKMNDMLLHKSFGLIVLFAGVAMLIVRRTGKRPAWPSMKAWEKKLAGVVHIGLYLCLLVMPISGILMSQMRGYSVKFFGLTLPNLVSPNEQLSGVFHETHEITAWVLLGLVSVHIFAALFHHFIRKDNVLKRMLPFG